MHAHVSNLESALQAVEHPLPVLEKLPAVWKAAAVESATETGGEGIEHEGGGGEGTGRERETFEGRARGRGVGRASAPSRATAGKATDTDTQSAPEYALYPNKSTVWGFGFGVRVWGFGFSVRV